MRIVGGIYRGRTLFEFEKIGVRPTGDMAREGIFNVLQFKVGGCAFLDLFCGTGAMGIEALSRGASQVVFNDISRESVNLTKKNLDKLGIKDAQVFNLDAVSFLQNRIDKNFFKFDIIYLDPPYNDAVLQRVLPLLYKVLTPDGVAVIETEKDYFNGYLFDAVNLVKVKEKRYGRANLTFLKKQACVFAGTFDPVTRGHIDIIKKCADKFSKVIVVLGDNPDKTALFNRELRLEFLRTALSKYQNVSVVDYNDYKEKYKDFLLENGVGVYVRGIRNDIDKAYEDGQIEINKALYPFVRTEYFTPEKEVNNISSTYFRTQVEKGSPDFTVLPEEIIAIVKKALK